MLGFLGADHDLEATPILRAGLALFGVAALAIGLASANAPTLLAAGAIACAMPVLLMRSRINARVAAERRERDRIAHFDRQIVEIVRRHAALLERRKTQLAHGLERGRADTVWERDIALFHSKFVQPGVAPLQRSETEDEVLCRVRLVVDEILDLRARVSRRAAA